jgi:lipopolysaccharide heptosyltransferase II
MITPKPGRVLLTRMKFIGDVILTTPIIESVRAALPGAYIAYLGAKDAVSLLGGNPYLDEVISYDTDASGLPEFLRVVGLLRRRKFDLAIDMFNNPRSALLTRVSGATVRVGLERSVRASLYTVRVRDDGSPKTPVEFHSQFLKAVGIPSVATTTRMYLTPDELEQARAMVPDGDGPLIGLHPGATWPAKRWLPERFAALADEIQRRGARVMLTAGPNDMDAIREVLEATVNPPSVLPVVPLRQLAAAISCCSAYVSNDAGPMHISAALGVPTIGIFGPGEENIWFPYSASAGNVAFRHNVECHPCHKDFCPREGSGYMECMRGLEIELILSSLARFLR